MRPSRWTIASPPCCCEVFLPSLFATITTAVGLLSLAVSEVSHVRDFGIAGAIGVTVIFAWNFGPGLSFLRLGCRALAKRYPIDNQKYEFWKNLNFFLLVCPGVFDSDVGKPSSFQ